MDESIFIDEKFSQTTDLLRHLVDNSEQMPLILGEPGTGKTTLLKHLTDLAADEWDLCLVEATPMLQPDQLFAHLGRCFSVSDQSPGLEEITQQLEDLNMRGELPIILVDDAHQLPVATIITLLQLYERHPHEQLMVKVVLFALPQIDLLLKTPQIQAMNHQMIQALDLSPMSKDRVEHFVQFLLNQMEPKDSFEISQGQLNGIYRASGGNQRRVVSELRQLLNRKSGVNQGKKGALSLLADLSAPVMIGGVLITALILVVVVFQDEINALFEERKVVKTPQQETIEKEIEATQPDQSLPPLLESQPGQPAVAEAIPDQSPGHLPATEPVLIEQESAISPTETLGVIQKPMINELPAELIPETTDRETPPASSGDQALSHETATLSTTRTIGEDNSAIIEAVSTLKKKEPQMQHKPPAGSTQALNSEAITRAPTPPEKPDSRLKPPLREQWLLAQNPASYTLQVAALQNEKGVRQFIEQHKLSDKVAYFRTKKEGNTWFSILFGIYPDKGSAVAAIKTLPRTLQKSDVWPRRLKSIQRQLQKQ